MDFVIYLVCLGVGLLFTLISATMGHVFGHDAHLDGSGGHAETGADSSAGPGISAFSPMILASFVTAFGGVGIILHQLPVTRNPLISAPLAFLGGFVIAGIAYSALKTLFQKTQSSSEARVANLVGVTATIITPIPENGVGEIAYVQAGTRYTAPAREEHGASIASGRAVRVTRVVGTQFFVTAA